MASGIDRALGKIQQGNVPYNIAAAFQADVSPPDLDGARWLLVVTDGTTSDDLHAQLSGSEGGSPGMQIDTGVVERAVEERAGSFDVRTRLADMVAASPLTLRADDLR